MYQLRPRPRWAAAAVLAANGGTATCPLCGQREGTDILAELFRPEKRNTKHGLGRRLGNVLSKLVAIAKNHGLGVPGRVPDEFQEWERLAPACIQLMESMYWSMRLV